ncbi:MAG: SlyX family protein [Candidatus Saccharibacteria bacterium]|nr:SlyX family protein [Rhodoferax sp.]
MDSHSTLVDQRLMELEIKASFTEDLVDQLNQIIIRQQHDLDALARQVAQLRAQLPEPGTGQPRMAHDELPPHY